MGIDYFRTRLLLYLLVSIGLFGFVAWIPSVYYGFAYELYSIIFIDTLALGWVFFLLAKKQMPFFRKTLGLLAVFYLLGIWLLIGLGPAGAGFMWLLLFSVMAGILLELKAALISFGLNLASFCILSIFVFNQILTWQFIPSVERAIWTVKGMNFICINAILAVSTGFLITKISQMAREEKQRSQTLDREVKARIRAEAENTDLTLRLYQSQKMEAMGTLAGGIAHDFNNILSIIKGYTELALAESDLSAAIQKDLGHINRAADRATDIIRQILAFSRHQSSEKKPTDLATIARECIEFFKIGIPGEVTLESRIPSSPFPILADRNQIYQVVMNMLTNGLQALDPGGGKISLSLDRKGDQIRLQVEDTGKGIPSKNIPLIFDPYFTTKETGKGTGMGLSISHGIVRAHGGNILVESSLGEGSRFTLVLPAGSGADETEKNTDGTPVGGRDHILLIDDEPDILTVQTRLLSAMGYRIKACSNPNTALDILKNTVQAFDIVITDQKMPGMTGHDLRARILAIQPDLPVILCSGFPDPGQDPFFDLVLTKPVSASRLDGAVRQVLDRIPQISC